MKAFSELTSASQVNNSDLLAISQESGNDFVSKKTTVKEVADFANQNLADEYDSTSTYAVDDFVMYESALYKCVTAVSSAEAFDPTKWTQVVVTDEMGSGGGGNANERVLSYAEYQALSEAQKMNNTTYYIYDINGDGSQFQPIIFSKTEREIGVWIDGKPLYQKTLSIPTSSQNTTYDVSSLDIDTCVKIDAFMSGNGSVPDGYWYSSSNFVSVNYYDGDLFINAPTQYSNNSPCIVTLQYTKSTDTAGSGTWTPQGVPAVHYSTDEHVVGTWIDGKDIWEKTVFVTTNNTTPFVLATGVSTLISSKGCIGDYSIPAPYFDSNRMYLSVLFAQTAHEVRVYSSGSNYNNLTGYVTIQYTKTS